ncbi:hypothetical protein GCM10011579_007040 [Streptomyces albiflavescens]|uniref:Uncharacterized protein n=1 Tax=Streptomyces albiflavescens TaxID=1623582 RepID=A0A917XS57_9ACTN|nr:hypothetical protein GCM10011579_007040 [Streptomyces albiflavescens]
MWPWPEWKAKATATVGRSEPDMLVVLPEKGIAGVWLPGLAPESPLCVGGGRRVPPYGIVRGERPCHPIPGSAATCPELPACCRRSLYRPAARITLGTWF